MLAPLTKILMISPNLEPPTMKSVSYSPVFKAYVPYWISAVTVLMFSRMFKKPWFLKVELVKCFPMLAKKSFPSWLSLEQVGMMVVSS